MFWENKDNFNYFRLFDPVYHKEFNSDEINSIIDKVQKSLESPAKSLVALISDNSANTVFSYLACLRSGNSVLLLNMANEPALLNVIIETYKPEYIIKPASYNEIFNGYTKTAVVDDIVISRTDKPNNTVIYPETAVLLSTSGTTGSPKLVRLSYKNIQSNADSISQYLDIDSNETAITSLPLSYSYGLSVLNSHILSGGKIVCSNDSFAQKDFWNLFREQNCTSFAGVPFNYQILERLRFSNLQLPSLRTFTQAGGRLAPEKISIFNDIAIKKGCKFFVMYGQTEATARISYVPFEQLSDKIGSAGIPVPGGKIDIVDSTNVLPPNAVGEVVYSGPNVMLGYADSAECLAKGDELNGTLYTGDIGYKDNNGFLYITGRKKRFVKIVGLRLNLDDIEKSLEAETGNLSACLMHDDELNILIQTGNDDFISQAVSLISGKYGLHKSLINVKRVSSLVFTTSGKKDYEAMKSIFV